MYSCCLAHMLCVSYDAVYIFLYALLFPIPMALYLVLLKNTGVANSFVCVMKLLDVSRKTMKDEGLGEESGRVAFTFSPLVLLSHLIFFPSILFFQ